MDLRRPPAEIHVDMDLARRLLESQHPHLQGELTLADEGWDNFIFRVGDGRAMRIPRREVAVRLLLNEQKWLPLVAPWLSFSVPLPIAVGVPSALFPWPWSVVEWIPGRTAEREALEPREAEPLAMALRSLHRAAPPDAPFNPFRGVPLEARRQVVEERLARLRLRELDRLWRSAIEIPPAVESVWVHGDLHPRNVLVREGRVTGIIDWGDMTGGDPATDLACAWMLFGAQGRAAFLRGYGPTPAERGRAIGWAVNFGSAMLDSGEAAHAAIGRRVIRELIDSA